MPTEITGPRVDFTQPLAQHGRQGRMAQKHVLSTVVVCSFALALGCSSSSGSGSGANGVSSECKAGANAAYANPGGTPWSVPQGITLVSSTNEAVEGNCYFDVTPIEYGGDIIRVCLKLENTTDKDITVTLPAGLVVKPTDAKLMNGILLQSHDIVIHPGKTEQVLVKQTSINEHCVFTQKEPAVYQLDTVTTDPGLLAVIDLMKDKQTSSDTAMATQQAVWNVTDHGGLTDDDRAAIAAMPAKKKK